MMPVVMLVMGRRRRRGGRNCLTANRMIAVKE